MPSPGCNRVTPDTAEGCLFSKISPRKSTLERCLFGPNPPRQPTPHGLKTRPSTGFGRRNRPKARGPARKASWGACRGPWNSSFPLDCSPGFVPRGPRTALLQAVSAHSQLFDLSKFSWCRPVAPRRGRRGRFLSRNCNLPPGPAGRSATSKKKAVDNIDSKARKIKMARYSSEAEP
jgi:hypothetical protein